MYGTGKWPDGGPWPCGEACHQDVKPDNSIGRDGLDFVTRNKVGGTSI